jgi:hypothetical protein
MIISETFKWWIHMDNLNLLRAGLSLSFLFSVMMTQNSQASADSAVSSLLNSVQSKILNPAEFKSKFCRKADVKSGIYSVRSGSGVACNNKVIAALAEYTCRDYEDFASSQCHINALKVLGQEAVNNPINVLAQSIETGNPIALKICSLNLANKLPSDLRENFGVVEQACASAPPPRASAATGSNPTGGARSTTPTVLGKAKGILSGLLKRGSGN